MAYHKRLSISREDVIKRCRKHNFDPAEYLIEIAKTGYLGNDARGKGKEKAGVRERMKAAELLLKCIVPQQKAIEIETNERKEITVKVKSFQVEGEKRALHDLSGQIIDVKVDPFDESAGDAASQRRIENSSD